MSNQIKIIQKNQKIQKIQEEAAKKVNKAREEYVYRIVAATLQFVGRLDGRISAHNMIGALKNIINDIKKGVGNDKAGVDEKTCSGGEVHSESGVSSDGQQSSTGESGGKNAEE